MEKYNILVLDTFEAYGHRLRAALEEVSRDGFSVFYAKNAESINEIRVNYHIHMMIVSEEWKDGNDMPPSSGAVVFALKEDAEAGRQEGVLYRNDPMDKTALQIVHTLTSSTKIIGVTGVGGGSGKTTAAMALAISCAEDRKKVFYLSLEAYAASLPFSRKAALGFAEVLVALDDPDGLETVIERSCVSAKRFENIETFAFSERNADRVEMSPKDIGKLLSVLKRMGRWDIIVVDLESRMDDVLFEVWQQAAKMILMIPQTAIALEKLRVVEQELEFRQRRGEAELNKLVPVLNFYTGELNGFNLFSQPVRTAIADLNRMGVSMYNLTSQQWCEVLKDQSGRKVFGAMYSEVTR